MEANVEILWPVGDAIIVRLEVSVEKSLGILSIVLQRLEHRVGTEISEGGVIDLDVAETLGVKGLELLLVGLSEVGKELLVIGISITAVALSGTQSQVEIARRGHGELGLGPLLLRQIGPKELPVLEVRALIVLDLPLANGRHGVLLAGLLQRSNRGRG